MTLSLDDSFFYFFFLSVFTVDSNSTLGVRVTPDLGWLWWSRLDAAGVESARRRLGA